MCTVCSYIFQDSQTLVGTGNFNSFWVCNFNKCKKITRLTPQSAKASHVAHSSEQESRVCAGERQPRRGLTWFPSLYFQPCWRTPKKVARMRSAEASLWGPRCPQSPATPLPHPSRRQGGREGGSISIRWPSMGSAKRYWSSIWPAVTLRQVFPKREGGEQRVLSFFKRIAH